MVGSETVTFDCLSVTDRQREIERERDREGDRAREKEKERARESERETERDGWRERDQVGTSGRRRAAAVETGERGREWICVPVSCICN